MPQQPYSAIFPDTDEPVLILSLPRKTGKIPKGDYGFIEFYCTDKDCDCRRVTIMALDRNMKTKAVIGMGFDPGEPYSGPFLDDFHEQSSYADELLEHFVMMINQEPENLAMMQRHYREVRSKVDGKKYRGKPFPKPGSVIRTISEPPGLTESFEELIRAVATAGAKPSSSSRARAGSPETPDLPALLKRYHALQRNEKFSEHSGLQDELRRYLLNTDGFGEEISRLLVEQCSASNDDMVDAALRILFDMVEILRVELERGRKDSSRRMERFQAALARHVYLECGDADLCAAVSHVLLQGRIELLPVLHEANNTRLMEVTENPDLFDNFEGNPMEELFAGIGEITDGSPFEALENLLQILALNPADMQIGLCSEMLGADSALIRDMAALMILHPSAEVRAGVAQALAARAASITPETLRRLIISRNWFPEESRANIDTAISLARRSRVECAPLPKSLKATVYASPIDGAAAQSFQVITPEGKGFKSCSILLKRGEGVADAFVIPLANKRELNQFLKMMGQEGAFLETSADYLDLRVCQALADGAEQGKAPNYWLLQVAEILGKDQWKAISFDPERELTHLRSELESRSPELLDKKYHAKALKESAEWFLEHTFAHSWFEDDAEVDDVIEAAFRKKKRVGMFSRELAAIDAIFSGILEKRRRIWLERFTLCALWLKSSRTPPVPWQQMYHLAAAIADEKQKLAKIPLMEMVASHSLGAYLERKDDERAAR